MDLEKLLENNCSTVVAEFIPSAKKEDFYQSEAMLESAFIKQLENQGYEYARIFDEASLKANLKRQIERLNECEFSPNEWNRFFNEILGKENESVQDKTRLIQKNYLHNFIFDNGKSGNIKLVDKRDLQNNHLQVISQLSVEANEGRTNRYDVSILVNGLPLVHIELKRRGKDLRKAFYQIKRYGRESFFKGSSLFNFVQIFIISNGTYTKYYSNSIRNKHIQALQNKLSRNDSFEFTSFWADFDNKQIFDLVDFTATFLNKRNLLNVLLKYCVFDANSNLLVLRPYQIAAVEAIMAKVLMALNYKHYGGDWANGYIWHSTGSGKTLTSFKTAQLLTNLEGIAKVLFVVDRKDLDNQTVSEYNKFEENCVDFNKSTKILEKNLKDESKKIIVTTIQKLSNLVQKNKNIGIYNAPCVIIFDECHRSQFGAMNANIKKAFKKYLLFGFTGTPIKEKNSTEKIFIKENNELTLKALTTQTIFNECLHSYTIVNAIKDKNVLPFKVDYHNVLPRFKDSEKLDFDELDDEKITVNKALLNHKDRIKEIVSYVLEHFDVKTYRNGKYQTREGKRILGFNALFACSSIEAARLYYDEFKRQISHLSEDKRIKIAAIFSFASDENKDSDNYNDENIENIEKLPKSSRDFLEKAIKDYNAIFKTHYSTNSLEFEGYYNDVSKKLKSKALDMLIVVDMFLTGFDAKTLNTLFVDKNLRYHGLIQAYSRTNRILDSTKKYGNIVCFRDLEKATNEAVLLFSSQNDDSKIVLMKSFKEYFEGYFEEKTDENGQIIREFKRGYRQIVENLKDFDIDKFSQWSKEQKIAFVKTFNEALKMQNLLVCFDEFKDNELLTQRQMQDFKGTYLLIKDEIKVYPPVPSVDSEDLVFEIEFLRQDDINFDFIKAMLEHAKNEDKSKEDILADIARWVSSSITLRNKADLINDFATYFINLPTNKAFIDEEWRHFVKMRKKEEFLKLVKNERLDESKAILFMQNAFKNKEMSDLGTDFSEILPTHSLFKPQSQKDSNRVFVKLCDFYEKYIDISANEI